MGTIAHNRRKMFDLTWALKLHTGMSFRATTLRRSLLPLLFLGVAAKPLVAQVPNSPIVFAQSAITTSFVSAPNFGGSGGSGSSSSQWLKVEVHYAVIPPPPLTFVDSAEFRVWIEGRDLFAPEAPTKDGIAVGLTGTVTYVNLAAARDAYAVFYVPPATIARYSTSRGASDFDRTFDVHVEAYVGGAKVDVFDKNKETDANWYQQLKALPGFVYRQDQSPFILADPDRYPPVKLPTTAAQ
jgi:hypothetical protein